MSEAASNNTRRRTAVLAKIRGRLGVTENDKTRELSATARMSQHEPGTLPQKGNLHGAARLQRFISQAKSRGITVHTSDSMVKTSELIRQIAPAECYATEAVKQLGLSLDLLPRKPRASIDCCVSTCLCAIAETGTIVLSGGEQNPTTDMFLADVHIVLLAAEDIEPNMEAVWQRLRQDSMPRHLTMVSGPSSTGDIEMQMEKGVHGPRGLQVILMESV